MSQLLWEHLNIGQPILASLASLLWSNLPVSTFSGNETWETAMLKSSTHCFRSDVLSGKVGTMTCQKSQTFAGFWVCSNVTSNSVWNSKYNGESLTAAFTRVQPWNCCHRLSNKSNCRGGWGLMRVKKSGVRASLVPKLNPAWHLRLYTPLPDNIPYLTPYIRQLAVTRAILPHMPSHPQIYDCPSPKQPNIPNKYPLSGSYAPVSCVSAIIEN